MGTADMSEHQQDTPRPDLTQTAAVVADVVRGVSDEDLGRPTPCPGTSVAAMLDHVAGLTMAFTAAAQHQPVPGGDQPPSPDASRLDPAFRESIPAALTRLAEAWRAPEAWTGATKVGGVDLPRQVAGLVALDEVVVHGWDLAVATAQPYDPPAAGVEGAQGFVGQAVAENPGGTPGLFGPRVAVPDEAPALHRLLGLTGRDPQWRPSSRSEAE
jgi:uncharacterized protein (TIGR03086 family)